MNNPLVIVLLRLLAAAFSGLLVYASYEPHGWFVAGIAGMAVLFLAYAPRSFYSQSKVAGAKKKLVFSNGDLTGGGGFLIGLVHGLSLYLLLLPWIGEFVGAMPYVALSIVLALFSGGFGVFATLCLRKPRGILWYAFIYVAVEYLRSNYPFGGFAWVRLAWGQINGPLAQLASYGGPALVTFTTVIVSLSLVCLAVRRSKSAIAVLLVVGVAAGSAWLTNGQEEDTGRVRVAAIQGNVPRMGLDFNAQRRAVLANHVRETQKLGSDNNADIIIWPENSSDVNPFTDVEAADLIDEALRTTQRPILVGTITREEDGPKNTMVVMDPDSGAGDKHNKKFLQPFGEYMPWRDFFRMITPMVDMAGNFTPGTGTGVVRMNAESLGRAVALGVVTCYEVAFDAAGRDAVLNGAEILTTPTNNATFGFTDMTYQQLAMSRMRALELDRAVVVAATSGVSALVQPDGEVTAKTQIFEPATLQDSMPLRDSITVAARYGLYVELALVIIGAFIALWLVVTRKRDAKI